MTLWFLVHGCDTVSGGAVELSWKLRPASSSLDDKFVDCNSGKPFTGEVRDIVLHWQVNGEEGAKPWRCDFNHGVTGFDLAEGTAQLWVTPACVSGDAAPDTYIAPAIVERTVVRGQTVSLGAVELVVAVSECRNPSSTDAQEGTRPCICCAGEVCTPLPQRWIGFSAELARGLPTIWVQPASALKAAAPQARGTYEQAGARNRGDPGLAGGGLHHPV